MKIEIPDSVRFMFKGDASYHSILAGIRQLIALGWTEEQLLTLSEGRVSTHQDNLERALLYVRYKRILIFIAPWQTFAMPYAEHLVGTFGLWREVDINTGELV
jgi:hypothetical protein